MQKVIPEFQKYFRFRSKWLRYGFMVIVKNIKKIEYFIIWISIINWTKIFIKCWENEFQYASMDRFTDQTEYFIEFWYAWIYQNSMKNKRFNIEKKFINYNKGKENLTSYDYASKDLFSLIIFWQNTKQKKN